MSGSSTTLRLAEALAALSLATDVGNGLPLETSLREAVVAARLAQRAEFFESLAPLDIPRFEPLAYMAADATSPR